LPLLIVKKQTPRQAIPLKQLLVGQSARIARVLGHPDQVHQLAEFGLRGGTKIEMFRRGNPCIIRLAGSKVCLRADDLLSVLVEPAATH
jgi:Fe2+ transport system protein FeoA